MFNWPLKTPQILDSHEDVHYDLLNHFTSASARQLNVATGDACYIFNRFYNFEVVFCAITCCNDLLSVILSSILFYVSSVASDDGHISILISGTSFSNFFAFDKFEALSFF